MLVDHSDYHIEFDFIRRPILSHCIIQAIDLNQVIQCYSIIKVGYSTVHAACLAHNLYPVSFGKKLWVASQHILFQSMLLGSMPTMTDIQIRIVNAAH